jgi:hypothetical protein
MSPRPKGFRRKLGRLMDTFGSVASGQFSEPLGDVRFVVFAHARSGSTSFVRALERHPRVRVLNEPFSETFNEWHPHHPDYHSVVTDPASLDRYVRDMYAECNGIKVLSYQRSRELYEHLLRSPDRRVILMRRANLLQSVVSMMVSEQTDVWHSWDVERPIEELYAQLRPLDADDVRSRMNVLADEIAFYDRVLDDRIPADVLKLTYEDVYLGGRGRDFLDEATRFLDLDPVADEEADALLDPARTKLNSRESYAFVPNAAAIDAALGSDTTGWLLAGEHLDAASA